MTAKLLIIFLGKVLISTLAFIVGMLLGGIITTTLGIQPPTLPPEIDATTVTTLMLATSPLLVLSLYFVNRGLAGSWMARGTELFLLSWIAYSLNNVLEAAIFTSYETGSWFTVVSFMPAIFFSAIAIAWFFPSQSPNNSIIAIWKEFFQQYTPSQWTWRLLLAVVIFVPIYYLFGMLVVPFVGDYYNQGESGLTVPSLSTLLLVLFMRSLLFLIACLPVIVAWQGGRLQLFFSLGFALFIMVGLLYMLAATWIAPQVRLVHSLEILADSFVYAGALVWLLSAPRAEPHGRLGIAGSYNFSTKQ